MEPSSKKKKEIKEDPLTRNNPQLIVEASGEGKIDPIRHRKDSITGSDRPSSDEDEEASRSPDGRRPASRRRRERNGRHAARKRPRRRHTDSEDGEEESSSGSYETSSGSGASSSVSESEEERERERRRRRRRRREKEREQERERDRRRRRKEKHRKHQEKARKEEERKKRKKKRKKEKAEKGKTGPVTDSWGKYGIIKEIDMWNKRPEFSAWLAEVKKVNLETLSAWEEKLMFKEYMEDFNTATLPKKYYDLDAYHRRKMMKEIEKGQKKQKQIERTEFNDEEQRRQELRREREQRKEAEVESLKRSMQSGMAQAMREQAQLREEMQYQYRLGNFEAAAAIQRRLDPDAPGASLK